MGELHVTATQLKTEQNKRRPGKSAHVAPVAVDVKPAAVYATTIISKEVASRTLGLSFFTLVVQFAPLLLSTFPGCGVPMRERSRLNSQMNQRDRAVGRRRYVWVQCRPVFVRLCKCVKQRS